MRTTKQMLLAARDAGPFDSTASLLRDLLDSPVGMVTVIDDAQQHAIGVSADEGGDRCAPRSESLCATVAATERALVLDDLLAHPDFVSHPALRVHGVRAYLGAPLRLADGNVVGSVCVFDVEPRDWTPSDRSTVEAFAAHVNRTLDDRLSAVNGTEDVLPGLRHEIGGSLAVVVGAIQTALIPGLADDRRRRVLEVGARTGRRLAATLDATLRLDLRTPLVLTDTSGREILDRAVDDQPGSRVSIHAEPVQLSVDAGLLVLLLRNLVSNAAKYTDGAIELAVVRRGDGGTRFSVTDHGHGLPTPSGADGVTEPFVRGEDVTTDGMGFGLHLVGRIARRIGAELTVDSSDHGTACHVDIPPA